MYLTHHGSTSCLQLYRRLRMFSESLEDRRDERNRRWARNTSKYMTNMEVWMCKKISDGGVQATNG
ncbi:hypothetical protein QR685DRAFT_310383 [Neurospora intermedia]|uniref:Uncharacterized protein n=1 Tax=Neurospora intermedia TaxID=5142 RepID=A0ABR3D7K3_NEUIN